MDNNLVLKFFFMVTVYLLSVTKVNSISCYQCAGCSNPFVNNTDSLSTCGTGLDTVIIHLNICEINTFLTQNIISVLVIL